MWTEGKVVAKETLRVDELALSLRQIAFRQQARFRARQRRALQASFGYCRCRRRSLSPFRMCARGRSWPLSRAMSASVVRAKAFSGGLALHIWMLERLDRPVSRLLDLPGLVQSSCVGRQRADHQLIGAGPGARDRRPAVPQGLGDTSFERHRAHCLRGRLDQGVAEVGPARPGCGRRERGTAAVRGRSRRAGSLPSRRQWRGSDGPRPPRRSGTSPSAPGSASCRS